eukprot:6437661-Alexandrium_andersonii.AAC.1
MPGARGGLGSGNAPVALAGGQPHECHPTLFTFFVFVLLLALIGTTTIARRALMSCIATAIKPTKSLSAQSCA